MGGEKKESLCDLKTYVATVIKTAQAWWGDGHTSGTEERIPKHTHSNMPRLFLTEVEKKSSQEIQAFQQIVPEQAGREKITSASSSNLIQKSSQGTS